MELYDGNMDLCRDPPLGPEPVGAHVNGRHTDSGPDKRWNGCAMKIF